MGGVLELRQGVACRRGPLRAGGPRAAWGTCVQRPQDHPSSSGRIWVFPPWGACVLGEHPPPLALAPLGVYAPREATQSNQNIMGFQQLKPPDLDLNPSRRVWPMNSESPSLQSGTGTRVEGIWAAAGVKSGVASPCQWLGRLGGTPATSWCCHRPGLLSFAHCPHPPPPGSGCSLLGWGWGAQANTAGQGVCAARGGGWGAGVGDGEVGGHAGLCQPPLQDAGTAPELGAC